MAMPQAVRLTSVKTGISTELCSVAMACDFLGRSGGYLKWKMFEEDAAYVTNSEGEQFTMEIIGVGKRRDAVPEDQRKKKRDPSIHPEDGYNHQFKKQLCFECARAAGFCSWSRNLTPVEGWDAEPSNLGNSTGCSYRVEGCPLYIKDGKTKEEQHEQRRMLQEERRNMLELQGRD